MKGSTVAFVSLGIFNFGLWILGKAADKHAQARAAVDAVNCRPDNAKVIFEEAEKRCKLFNDLVVKEKKDMEIKLHDWRAANNFDLRKHEILDTVAVGIDKFKKDIDYSDQLASLNADFDASVEAFKNSIDYDSLKESLEEAIEAAKSHYEDQKTAFDLAGDDISDVTMKLRHAAEEAMNSKVKESKDKLDALEKQLKTECDKLQKTKNEKVRVLEEKISKERVRLSNQTDDELRNLNVEYVNAKNDISRSIADARTREEAEAVIRHEEDIRTVRLQKEADADLAKDILASRPSYERIGAYLKSKKIPKPVVAVAGCLPLIPVEYLVAKYVKFLVLVVKGM